MKTYTELCSLPTFEERFEYLKSTSRVGEDTFGFDRYLNQVFYRSDRWRKVRDQVIIRDGACDLADPEHEINGRIIIHHMNPLRKYDIENETEYLLNPEYLICTSHNTHNAIHYGDKDLLPSPLVERRPNDTCPWK